MREYINKDSIIKLNTFVREDESLFKVSADGLYYDKGVTITETQLTVKHNLIKIGGIFYYNKPQIEANNFIKIFLTSTEMYNWIAANLPQVILVNETVPTPPT